MKSIVLALIRSAKQELAKISGPVPIDSANLAAQWTSVAAITAVGLGGLIAQAESIRDQLDTFHKDREEKVLGEWVEYQLPQQWYQLVKPPPRGPIIKGNYLGLCGVSVEIALANTLA